MKNSFIIQFSENVKFNHTRFNRLIILGYILKFFSLVCVYSGLRPPSTTPNRWGFKNLCFIYSPAYRPAQGFTVSQVAEKNGWTELMVW